VAQRAQPLRVGIVSAGWGAFAHLPAWRAVPGVEVTAICTLREETARAAAQRHGIARPFWDAAAMCADPDIDIVDLGTRPSVRLAMVLAALQHSKHVYNGAPHAPHWAGAKAIDAARRSAGTVGVVDAFARWLPAHRQLAALLDEGYLGEPRGGSCRFSLSLFNTPSKAFPYNWFADGSAGVSALRNNGGHLLYLLLELFGPVAEVVADDRQLLKQWVFPDGDQVVPGSSDYGTAMLRFASGMTLQLEASWATPAVPGWSIDVFGSQGRLVTRSPSFPTARDCTLHGGRVGEALAEIAIPEGFRTAPGIGLDWQAEVQPSYPMALSMEAMVAAIGGAGHALPNFAAGLEAERVLEAMRVSSSERRWVATAEIV
jgi:predicted dehydrogenase